MKFKPLRVALPFFCCFLFWNSFARQTDRPAQAPVPVLIAQQATHLALLGQVWGFLKYYHPEVAKGKFDWDAELFKILPAVKSTTSDEAFSSLLLHWIDGLGKAKDCRKCSAGVPEGLMTDNIDLAWMRDTHFSAALQEQLYHVLVNRNTESGYYAKFSKGTLSFAGDSVYHGQAGLYVDENFRLLALFRYWNIIQYFSPNKHVIGRNWNEVLYEYVPRLSGATDTTIFHRTMKELVHKVHDTHAQYYVSQFYENYQLRLPVMTFLIRGELVVTYNHDDSLAALSGLKKGDVIEKVDGHPVKELIKERAWLVNGSNEAAELRNMSYLNVIAGGPERVASLVVRRGDQRLDLSVKRYLYSEMHLTKMDSTYCKILPGNIGYINLAVLKQEQVDSAMQRLKNTSAIIFDDRTYPNGTASLLAKYLYEERPAVWFTYPNTEYPGAFEWAKEPSSYGQSKKDKKHFLYTGKVAILVDVIAQSHGEWSAMVLQATPGSITVGSQTAGADGNVSRINFPDGHMSLLTGLGVYYPDKSPTQRVGVKVDKVVIPTPAGIAAGRDEVLEAAMREIGNRQSVPPRGGSNGVHN
jgi:C-terminal processing protease CtpA/Prc